MLFRSFVVQFNLEGDWNGLYGGTWGSQVDFGDGKFVEYDFYGGYATSYKDLTIDVGMIQYNYNKFIDESVEEWYAIETLADNHVVPSLQFAAV